MKFSTAVMTVLVFLVFVQNANAVLQTVDVSEPCRLGGRQELISYKGLAYFCTAHELLGGEVHVTNGNPLSTTVLKDIGVGPGRSSPRGFFKFKDSLFFLAETTATGFALWRTDGTKKGTKLIRSLNIGQRVFQLEVAAELNGSVYFRVDFKFYKTNGTTDGTFEIDVPVTFGVRSSTLNLYRSTYYLLNNQLFVMTNSKLYRVNNDNSSTLISALPAGDEVSGYIYPNISLDGKMLILTYPLTPDPSDADYIFGPELWVSNGTPSGTAFLSSDPIRPIGNSKDGRLLFVNQETEQLFVSDGNGQTLVKQTNGVGALLVDQIFMQHQLAQLEVAGSIVFPGRGQENTWITDGTESGTKSIPLKSPFELVEGKAFARIFDGKLIGGGLGSDRVSSYDIATGDVRVLTIDDSFDGIRNVTLSSQGIYFFKNQKDLWISNGTAAGTRFIQTIPGAGIGQQVWTEGHRFYFTVFIDSEKRQFWHSDGTTQGTYALRYQFENGEPPPVPELDSELILAPIIDLLLNN